MSSLKSSTSIFLFLLFSSSCLHLLSVHAQDTTLIKNQMLNETQNLKMKLQDLKRLIEEKDKQIAMLTIQLDNLMQSSLDIQKQSKPIIDDSTKLKEQLAILQADREVSNQKSIELLKRLTDLQQLYDKCLEENLIKDKIIVGESIGLATLFIILIKIIVSVFQK